VHPLVESGASLVGCDRVRLLVTRDRPFNNAGWGYRTRELRPLPDLRRASVQSRDVLTQSGEGLIFTAETPGRVDSLQVRLLVFATGEVTAATLELPCSVRSEISYTLSPSMDQMVVAHGYSMASSASSPSYESARVELVIGTVGGQNRASVPMGTFSGVLFGEADDVTVQWAPSRSWVACAIAVWRGGEVGFQPVVSIFDVASARAVQTWEALSLVGSASWNPDGTTLLVRDYPSGAVSILNVETGAKTRVPEVSGDASTTTRRGLRPLGFADSDRLLIAKQRGSTMTLSALRWLHRSVEPIVRFSGGADMYPIIKSCPLADAR
jgi:hypothetical protein